MNLYVYSVESNYHGEEMVHTYSLRTEKSYKMQRLYEFRMIGASMEGKVIAVKRDKVQVRIDDDENSTQNISKWFLYSTVYSSPDGTGWYCMPEIGDTVRVFIPSVEEESISIIIMR